MARGITDASGSGEGIYTAEVGSVGVDNFTLGFWFYTSASTAGIKCYHGNAGGTGLGLAVNSTGSTLDVLMGGINWFIGGTFTLSQWNHGVLTRNGGTSQVYLNGSALGSTTTQAPNALAGTGNFFCGQAYGTGTVRVAEAFLYNRVLSAAEIALLANGYAPSYIPRGLVAYLPFLGRYDPELDLIRGAIGTVTSLVVHDHPRIIYPSYPQRFYRAISDVTVALTGISSTSAVGSFLPSHSVPTSGLSATGSIHTLGSSHTVVLTTNLGTSAVGTLAPSHAIALTTSLGTGEVGTLSPTFDFYAAITGVNTTGEVGSLIPSHNIAMISQTLTLAPGTLAPSNVVPSSGSEATASAGSLAPAFSLPTSTVVGTTAAGSLSSSRTVPITGEAGTGGTGTVTGEVATIYQAITGVDATGAVTAPGVNVTIVLSGILVACSPGNLGSTGGTPDLPDYIYFHRPYVRQEGH